MGRVAAPHGVRGAVKVVPLSAEPAALLDFSHWWLRMGDESAWVAHRVVESRMQSGAIVAVIDGVTTRDAAGRLRRASVGIPRESLPAPAPDEYYRSDLAGMEVVNRSGEVLGTVLDFVESGAHPIVRIAAPDGHERLIPWVANHVVGVDVDARRIDVDWAADY